MTAWIEVTFFWIVLTLLTPALGGYMATIFEGAPNRARRALGGFERLVYWTCRIDQHREMTWIEYLLAAVVFSGVSAVALGLALMVQKMLPLNPEAFA
jgi:K+-transporting ATPase ATPase A chain